MTEIHITAAVEDPLSEAVLRKIISETGRPLEIALCLNKGGNQYLKSKAKSFNKSAQGSPFLLLTDQDVPNECPSQKISNWLGDQPPHPNFLFRVAVMEIEAWVFADRRGISRFMSVPLARIPLVADDIEQPKEFLISLARSSSSSSVREDLVPRPNTTARVGPNYNSRLIDFALNQWNVIAATDHSPSLKRTFERLSSYEPTGI